MDICGSNQIGWAEKKQTNVVCAVRYVAHVVGTRIKIDKNRLNSNKIQFFLHEVVVVKVVCGLRFGMFSATICCGEGCLWRLREEVVEVCLFSATIM